MARNCLHHESFPVYIENEAYIVNENVSFYSEHSMTISATFEDYLRIFNSFSVIFVCCLLFAVLFFWDSFQ